MSFPRYPSYKPSGVEWLGEVPEHWEVTRLGLLCSKIGSGKTPLGGAEAYLAEGILFIRSQNVYDNGMRLDDVVYISEATDAEQSWSRVCPGDVLLNITGASLGRTCLVPEDLQSANVNQHVCIIRLWDAGLRHFVSMVLKSSGMKAQFDATQNGAAREGLNFAQISKLVFAVPSQSEQVQIATFLDRETAKIDALIAEQQRLIELLQEKRQAVISHAVTKGLNPDAPMKDSGVEWLGEVPEHWEVIEARREISFLTSGSRGWAEFYSEKGPLFLRIGNLTRDSLDIDLSDIQRVDPPLGSEGARTAVDPGDVLFSITAYLGSVAVVPSHFEVAYVSQHVCLARLTQARLLPKWLGYFVLSSSGKAYLEAESYGGTKIQLSLDDIKSFPLAVPPLSEQEDLISSIEEALIRLSQLSAESEKNIALLQERRSALIAAAVTGQIDVRGLVAEASDA